LCLYGLALGWWRDWNGYPHGGIGFLVASVACVVLALVLLVPWYAKGWLGAGGVKLEMGFAACAGALFGLRRGSLMVVLAVVISTVIAAVLLSRLLGRRDPGTKGVERLRVVPIGFILTIGAIASALLLHLLGS
jgi:hypothetical protein